VRTHVGQRSGRGRAGAMRGLRVRPMLCLGRRQRRQAVERLVLHARPQPHRHRQPAALLCPGAASDRAALSQTQTACEQSASAELRACLHAPRPDQDGQHPAAALCDRNRHAPAALVLTKHLAQAAAPGCHVAAVRLARFHCAYDGQAATRAGTRARAWSSCRTALPAPSAPTSRS